MSDFSKELEDLSPEDRELLLLLLQEDEQQQSAPIKSVPRDAGAHPLSYSQLRMWLLDQLEPGNPFYNVPGALSFMGSLDVGTLERCLNELIARHETLRTTFTMHDGRPSQRIHPEGRVPLRVIDLGHLPPNEREPHAERLALEEANKPFDLVTGPLARWTLFKLGDRGHYLVMVLHHIITDGWSMRVLAQELIRLYAAFSRQQPSPLPELSLQYVDFAAWEQQESRSAVIEQQLEFWKTTLAGAPPFIDIPRDHPRPKQASFRGTRYTRVMPPTVGASLKSFSQKAGVTPFVLLLTALNVLLYKWTQQSDLVVGTVVTGREQSEVRDIVGCFINTLPLRSELSSEETLRSLLERTSTVVRTAFANQDTPFDQIVNAVKPDRSVTQNPIYNIALLLHNFDDEKRMRWTDDLEAELRYLFPDTAQLELFFIVEDWPEGTRLDIQYNTDLFDASTTERMAEQFQTVIDGLVANPDQTVGNLSILSQSERRQVLLDWNDTASPYPQDQCLHQLFETQAEKTPDAVALVHEGRQLTYAELNRRANQVAWSLRELGVGPDQPVGLCLERSLEMIVGLLGILKAGGAYVPMDPEYPTDRLAFMLEDSRASLLLTQQSLLSRLAPHGARTLCLDSEWSLVASHPTTNPDSRVTPDHVAYIIYTSGSTGRPKGVEVLHRGLANLSWALQKAIYDHHRHPLKVGVNGSIAFDTSVKQWQLLAHGHEIHVLSSEVRTDSQKLLGYCRSNRLDGLDCTPSMLRLLLQEGMLDSGYQLAAVLVGGEAIDEVLWEQLAGSRQTEFYNVYGPTECTVDTTVCRIREAGSRPILGRAIANVLVYVVDPQLEPVPVGVPGELLIGGYGVARGYLNRPELTAEKFIPNPFGDGRVYRTGDLVRYLPDGNLEFLGRIDHQVKLRGFRIELGEIETTLAQYPGVRDVVVLAREDVPGDKRLVAYLVLDHALDIHELKAHLKQHMPDYMVPSAFVTLEAMPLTTNGKINRKALPAPDQSLLPQSEYLAPRTATEETLARIWQDVLGLERVGALDSFFELGGHSLLATRAVSRIREAFQLELPLRSFFESPVLAELAARIDAGENANTLAPTIVPVSREGRVPLSFAQQRLWFIDQLEPGNPQYNMPAAMRMVGNLDIEALERTLNEIVRRHEVLRTTFTSVNGEPVQVIHPRLAIPLPVVDLQQLSETQRVDEARRLAREEALRPFDLSQGPLLRTALLRLGEQEYWFLGTVHHIASDGWSVGVLTEEMAAIYPAFAKGEPSPLEELPLQYADFAHWQQHWLQGEILDREVGYWKQNLQGIPALLELPTDRPRAAVMSTKGANQSFRLSRELTNKLHELSRKEGATLFMTLLAAFQTLLHRYSAQEDVVVGSPIANRNRAEIEPLLGFFVNSLALRATFEEGQTFQQLLSQVKETTLGAYAHQDVPFEKLVEELQPERNLSYSPIFQVMFVLQNNPGGIFELPGVSLTMLENEGQTAKFDLTLSVREVEDGLVGYWEYATDLFDAGTIERMAGHFQTLLEGVVAHPGQTIGELSLLTEAERQQLLVEGNATDAACGGECVHHLFEAQVEKTPDAMALVTDDHRLTYAELNRKANQLAHHLQQQGVGPDSVVGICIHRSAEMIVAMLAVLKAGGAYLPLDPNYPTDRLAFMIEDSGAAIVLTQQALQSTLAGTQRPILCLDTAWPDHAESGNPVRKAAPNQLAYVIYTSGSTGKPKGVPIEHGALSNLIAWYHRDYGVTPEDRATQVASPSFDASVVEIWPILSGGASLYVPPEHVRLSAQEFLAWGLERGITVTFLPTPLAEAFINLELPSKLSWRLLLAGGDKLQRVPQHPLPFRLTNNYGPTENTVISTWAQAEAGQTNVPIGRPVTNTCVYVVDRHLQPVPVGVPGELLIGGRGLTRGYLNRPELTAEKFIPNPFGEGRVYRTGDLVRYLPDGNLEFLGRLDHQVKIRGFRIELGEIESMLGQHPAVQEVVVVAREDVPGDKRLVAYLVLKHGTDAQELKNHLKQHLPEYMVPSAMVILDAMPVTPNGKVDRKALPQPDQSSLQQGEYVPPRTPIEETLAGIWAEVLKVERVGITDHFFELGGHSLLVTQAASRVNAAFGVSIALRELFARPTIEALGELILETMAGEDDELALLLAELENE